MKIRISILWFLLQVIAGQTISVLDQQMSTTDRLGFLYNHAQNIVFNSTTYQAMVQNPDGTISIKNAIDNPSYNTAMSCKPSIALPKMARRANFRSLYKINITLNYNSANPGSHLFMVALDLSKKAGDPISSTIEIYIVKNNISFTGTPITVGELSFMKFSCCKSFFYFPNITNSSFSGIIDLDAWISYFIQQNTANKTDIIQAVRISGQMTTGSYDLSLSYRMLYDSLVYLKTGSVGNIGGYNCYLEVNQFKLNAGEYLEARTSSSPSQLSDLQVECNIIGLTDTTLKGFFQMRAGYYHNWVTPIQVGGIPLNPRQPLTYIMKASFTYNNPTEMDAVALCWILRLRSDYDSSTQTFTNSDITAQRQIHICPYWASYIQAAAEQIYIEQFIAPDQSGNTYKFRSSENTGSPYIHTFRSTTGHVTGDLNLFQFVTRLVNAGKIGVNELISGISFVFKAYNCLGYLSIGSITLPAACPSGYLQVTGGCLACNSFISGCLNCTSSSVCSSCDAQGYWILTSSTCSCLSGYYQIVSGTSTICSKCSDTIAGCLICTSASICITCDEASNWIKSSSSCVCANGFYQMVNTDPSLLELEINIATITQCVSCSFAIPGCIACSGNNNCSICDINSNWIRSGLICSCDAGFYLKNSIPKVCQSCGVIAGCQSCENNTVCLSCDIQNHWYFSNGICYCQNGYAQTLSGINARCYSVLEPNATISQLNTNILTCLTLGQQQTFQVCLNQSSLRASIILHIISTPNLIILFKVIQIYAFIDDFTYYIYHDMQYGEKFDIFVKFMWNLTNERFIPYSVAGFYYNIQDSYDKVINEKNRGSAPQEWADLGQGVTFLSNTRDCWLSLLPFNGIIFLLFNCMYRLLVYYESRFAIKLISFKWFSILAYSLISQNIQFISFISFQHILYGGPPNITPSFFAYVSNYVICYLTLFLIIVFACSGIGIMRHLLKKNIDYCLDYANYSQSTLFFFSLTQLIRLFNGFLHAWFYNNNLLQFTFIFSGQITILIVIVVYREIFKLKSFFTLITTQYIFRVVLHTYLFIRVEFKAFGYTLTKAQDAILDDSALILVFTLMTIVLFQMLVLTCFDNENKLQIQEKSGILNHKRRFFQNKFLAPKRQVIKVNKSRIKTPQKIDNDSQSYMEITINVKKKIVKSKFVDLKEEKKKFMQTTAVKLKNTIPSFVEKILKPTKRIKYCQHNKVQNFIEIV